MLSSKRILLLVLIFLKISSSSNIFKRNVQYYSIFPLESQNISNRKSHIRPLISQKTHAFITTHKFINYTKPPSRSTELFNTEDDLEKEVQDLYQGLKDKKWTFTDLKRRLTDEGISLEGCNKTDDVIRRVAQLSVLGKDELERRIQEDLPGFYPEYINALESYKSEYDNLSKKERKSFIQSLVERLKKYNSSVPEDSSDDDVMNLLARVQSAKKLEFQLPQSKNNQGAKTVEAYKAEADSIFSVYEKVKDDDYLKKNFMDEVKNELIMSNSDFEECVTDEDLINRLAYSRVFPKTVTDQGSSRKRKSPRGRKFLRNNAFGQNPLESFFTIQGDFADLGRMFDNGSDNSFENSLFESFGFEPGSMIDGLNVDGFSLFKDLSSMFGINPNQFSQQVEFRSSDDDNLQHSEVKFKRGDEEEMVDEDSDNHIETDPSLILLQQKARVTGDPKLQTILNKAIKDPTLRDVLKTAATKGYERARELCSGNVKALYILEKLNDKNIWS